MEGFAEALKDQPPLVVLGVAIIGAIAYVLVRWLGRSSTPGEAGRQAVEDAADFLTEKAVEERGLRVDAERERDDDRAYLTGVREELERAMSTVEECDARAQRIAAAIKDRERRRRGTS